ncbi:MAG: LytTR family DNA-binding domain-containing protein [Pseudomonadota bacterium]
MTLENYLRRRRLFEVLIVLALVLTGFVANSVIVGIDMGRGGGTPNTWLPWALEGSSHLALLIMVPVVIAFNARFPIRPANWRTTLPAHVGFSLVFSLGHVGLMYGFRKLLWRAYSPEARYVWPEWLREFGYEYLKDFRTYVMLLALVYLYSFILRRLQGEAELVAEGREQDPQQSTSERFLVKKLGREFLVRTRDIDWIEACGNYVNLHVGSRVYPLRDTMTRISDRLSEQGFQRVHRSAIVNLERIVEIQQFDSGDAEARLSSDTNVPVSRSYRKALRERLH